MSRSRAAGGFSFGAHGPQISFYKQGGVKTQSGSYSGDWINLYRDTVGLDSPAAEGWPFGVKFQFSYYYDAPDDLVTMISEALDAGAKVHAQVVEYNPQVQGPDSREDTPFSDRTSLMLDYIDGKVAAKDRPRVILYYGNEPDMAASGGAGLVWNGTDEEHADRMISFAAAAKVRGYGWGIGNYANLSRSASLLAMWTEKARASALLHGDADGHLAVHVYGQDGDPVLFGQFMAVVRKAGWWGKTIASECNLVVDPSSQARQQVERWTYHASMEAARVGMGLMWFMLYEQTFAFAAAMAEALRDTRAGFPARSYQYHRILSASKVQVQGAKLQCVLDGVDSDLWYSSESGRRGAARVLPMIAQRTAEALDYRGSDTR